MIRLARKTVWEELSPDAHRGLGQRVLATDAEDTPLMDIRSIAIAPSDADTTDDAGDHG
jgi:type VI secretion system protein ImpE